jgi:hypothetical protein
MTPTASLHRRKAWLRTGAFVLWIGLFGWLIRYEAYPELFTQSIDGYTKLVGKDMLVVDSWLKLLLNDAPIGYSYTTMDTDEADPLRYYQITSRVRLKVKILGELHDLGVDLTVCLNVAQKLEEFNFSFSSRQYVMRLDGKRKRGNMFRCDMVTGSSRQHIDIEIPDDVILHSPMTEMALSRLRPGQQVSIKVMDPTTLSFATMVVKAVKRETITVGAVTNECLLLSSDYQGANILSWMDARGEVLRQETSFGWTLEKCTPDEAAQALRAAGAAGDLLAGMAVRCEGGIRAPREATKLVLQLTGVPFAEEELTSNRQSMRKTGADEFELTLKPSSFPSVAATLQEGQVLSTYSQATPTIQSDHPDIRAAVSRIIKDAGTSEAKATAIHQWVYKNVAKETTLSLPSALDVLKTMKGDCNEHTALFVALARAAGLPAKTMVGVAYHQGAFYYHAWPAVFVGGWVEMDPTWGQETVDATHLALAEGELSSQMRIMKAIGKLRIRVLQEGPYAGPTVNVDEETP